MYIEGWRTERRQAGRNENTFTQTDRSNNTLDAEDGAILWSLPGVGWPPFCDLLLANSSLKTPLNLLCTQLDSFMGRPPDNVTPTLYIRRCAVKSGSVVAPSYILGITRDHKFTVPWTLFPCFPSALVLPWFLFVLAQQWFSLSQVDPPLLYTALYSHCTTVNINRSRIRSIIDTLACMYVAKGYCIHSCLYLWGFMQRF